MVIVRRDLDFDNFMHDKSKLHCPIHAPRSVGKINPQVVEV